MMLNRGRLIAFVIVTTLSQPLVAQDSCGSLHDTTFGPFDYTDKRNTVAPVGVESPLHLVERAHFTAQVENLVRGESSVNPLDDLDYTLNVFPNHHRALNAMARYYLKHRVHPEQKLGRYTAECWFSRAIQFTPNDAVVREVYGLYLAQLGQREKAIEQYKLAIELIPDFAEAHYNLGLLYVDMRRYEDANRHAVTAYKLGFPLSGLRTKLQQAGKWNPTVSQ